MRPARAAVSVRPGGALLDLGTRAVVAAALAYVAGSLLWWRREPLGLVVGNVFLLALPLLGGTLALAAAGRATGRARWFAGLAGLAAWTWAGGQAAYGYFDLVLDQPAPFPGPPDLFYVPAALLLVGSVLVAPLAEVHHLTRVRWAVDGLLLATTLFAASWVLLLQPLAGGDQRGRLGLVLAVFYPAADLAALVVALASMRRRAASGPILVFLVGMVVFAVGDSAYLTLSASGGYLTGDPVDVTWACGLLLMGMGARAFVVGTGEPMEPASRRWVPTVPGVVAGLVIPTLLVVHAVSDRGGAPLFISIGTAIVLLGFRQAVTLRDNEVLTRELRERERRFAHEAMHDTLTGLPNRRMLLDRAEDRQQSSPGTACCLLLVDFDGFKYVNDTDGHLAGDELLVMAAARLQDVVGEDDLVSRIGGDEFAVLTRAGATLEEAEVVANAIIESLQQPFHLDTARRPVRISASVGLAPFRSCPDGQTLLRNADLALYDAKNAGGARWSVFQPHLYTTAARQQHLLSDFDDAVEQHHFVAHYQPIVEVHTGTLIGFEALVRWQHPDLGLLSPTEFITLLERQERLPVVGVHVLEEACATVAAHNVGSRLAPLAISVNVSAGQVLSGSLDDEVARALELSGLPARLLTLELTETALVEDFDFASEQLSRLRDRGVGVSLDDFGTGYSSLSYLRQLPVDEIKVDASFTRDLDQPSTRELVGGIITLAHGLGLRVVVEGIETLDQLAAVRELGADLGQGFLFGVPNPVGPHWYDRWLRPDRVANASMASEPG